jgi:hypothetical protein
VLCQNFPLALKFPAPAAAIIFEFFPNQPVHQSSARERALSK